MGASPTRPPLQPEATGAVMEVTKWLKPSESVSRIGEPRLPLWVKSGPPAPCPFTSAFGGKADIQCPLSEGDSIFRLGPFLIAQLPLPRRLDGPRPPRREIPSRPVRLLRPGRTPGGWIKQHGLRGPPLGDVLGKRFFVPTIAPLFIGRRYRLDLQPPARRVNPRRKLAGHR